MMDHEISAFGRIDQRKKVPDGFDTAGRADEYPQYPMILVDNVHAAEES